MKHILILLIFCLNLTFTSCSSEDDSALKDGKVAANLTEADQLEPPYISALTINDSSAATNQTSVSVKLSGVDAVGIIGHIVSNQSTVPDLSSPDWVSITTQNQYSVSQDSTVGQSDGSYTIYGWMKDAANNISATASSSIFYDTTAPNIASVSINSGDSSTSNTVVNLTISASDSLSGINAYYASETSTDPSFTATSWVGITATNSLSSTVNFSLVSPGAEGTFTKTVHLWLQDDAGNVSSGASDSIDLIVTDFKAPTSPSISIDSGASSSYSSNVTLTLSATDGIGVTDYYISQYSSPPSSSAIGWTSVTSATSYRGSVSYTFTGGAGTATVYVWFKDAAGNVSSSARDNINLLIPDTTSPTLAEVTAVDTSTSNSTPNYTFSSDEAGTITYGGLCSSGTTSAIIGNNTITLSSLSNGTYSDCTIAVTDSVGNASNALTLTSFSIAEQMGGSLQGTENDYSYHPYSRSVGTFAGSGSQGCSDRTGTLSSFVSPWGITTDGTNLYIADLNCKSIRQIVISSKEVSTVELPTLICCPYGIVTDGTNLYFTENHTVRKLSITNGVVTTFSTLAGFGAGSADGTGTSARFYNPMGITTDGTNLYVADTYNHLIRQIVISTGVVTTLAGTGSSGSSNGTGTSSSFNKPMGITTDGTNLYVADTYNHLIRQIVILTGLVTTLAGTGSTIFIGHTSGGTSQNFNKPMGITTDGTNLYVASTNHHMILQIVISTGAISSVAGTTNSGNRNDNSINAIFSYPNSITTDGTNLYVSDGGNRTIRIIK